LLVVAEAVTVCILLVAAAVQEGYYKELQPLIRLPYIQLLLVQEVPEEQQQEEVILVHMQVIQVQMVQILLFLVQTLVRSHLGVVEVEVYILLQKVTQHHLRPDELQEDPEDQPEDLHIQALMVPLLVVLVYMLVFLLQVRDLKVLKDIQVVLAHQDQEVPVVVVQQVEDKYLVQT
jgi:hypothetical protein